MILELFRKCGIVVSFMILELSRMCDIVAPFMILELFASVVLWLNHNTTLAEQF
jgi:hypothetical protein